MVVTRGSGVGWRGGWCVAVGCGGGSVGGGWSRRRAIQVCIHAGNDDSVILSKFCLFGHPLGELWRRRHDS